MRIPRLTTSEKHGVLKKSGVGIPILKNYSSDIGTWCSVLNWLHAAGMAAQTHLALVLFLFILRKMRLGMKAVKLMRVMLAIVAVVGTTVTHAAETGDYLFYFGAGAAGEENGVRSDANSASLGFLIASKASDIVWGGDISGEGTMLESTWGNTSVTQGISYNFLIGKNLTKSERSRFDMALLVGMRESSSSCPKSYLGYQCYAGKAPDIGYEFNYGAVATWTYRRILLGVRVTGQSRQALIGLRF